MCRVDNGGVLLMAATETMYVGLAASIHVAICNIVLIALMKMRQRQSQNEKAVRLSFIISFKNCSKKTDCSDH